MRKLFLAANCLLALSITFPAFSQGVQLPSAPNATPPAGTVANGRSGTTARHSPPRRRQMMHRRVAAPNEAMQQGVQDPAPR